MDRLVEVGSRAVLDSLQREVYDTVFGTRDPNLQAYQEANPTGTPRPGRQPRSDQRLDVRNSAVGEPGEGLGLARVEITRLELQGRSRCLNAHALPGSKLRPRAQAQDHEQTRPGAWPRCDWRLPHGPILVAALRTHVCRLDGQQACGRYRCADSRLSGGLMVASDSISSRAPKNSDIPMQSGPRAETLGPALPGRRVFIGICRLPRDDSWAAHGVPHRPRTPSAMYCTASAASSTPSTRVTTLTPVLPRSRPSGADSRSAA